MQADDPQIECPYNRSHMILKSRMQAHLVKCKLNYPLANKMVCPFNAVHHVDKPDYQYHVSTCPDRGIVEGHKYEVTNDEHGDLGIAPYHEPCLPPSDENWDAETPVAAYDPSQRLESSQVLRVLQGATKSQRKAFRMKERQRMQRLQDGEDPSVTTIPVTQPGPSTTPDSMAPLRLPKQTSEAIRLLNPNLGLGRGMNFQKTEDNYVGTNPQYRNLGMGRGIPLINNELTNPIGSGRGKPVI